jgi:hypothetical protein
LASGKPAESEWQTSPVGDGATGIVDFIETPMSNVPAGIQTIPSGAGGAAEAAEAPTATATANVKRKRKATGGVAGENVMAKQSVE